MKTAPKTSRKSPSVKKGAVRKTKRGAAAAKKGAVKTVAKGGAAKRGAVAKAGAAKRGAAAKAGAAKRGAAAKAGAAKAGAAKRGAAKRGAAKRGAAAKAGVAKRGAVGDGGVVAGLMAKRWGARADLGAPIDGFFAKQPPHLREILQALRRLVEEVVPEAEGSIKWGMPFFTLAGEMMCALGGHRTHVNLVLAGTSDDFEDPEGRLTGTGKTGRHLKLQTLDDLPRDSVRRWLRAAAANARSKG